MPSHGRTPAPVSLVAVRPESPENRRSAAVLTLGSASLSQPQPQPVVGNWNRRWGLPPALGLPLDVVLALALAKRARARGSLRLCRFLAADREGSWGTRDWNVDTRHIHDITGETVRPAHEWHDFTKYHPPSRTPMHIWGSLY